MAKNLVIVESPAKAKTIEGFLGKDFTVKSSMGHIRDLVKKNMGVEVSNGFLPKYEVPSEKKHIVSELKKLADKAEVVWLASDEDREGEAISWHLFEALKLSHDKVKRIVFHEITKNAIQNAIAQPRTIDIHLVDAQQTRRILDRLVGFEISPVLWRKVQPKLSAGRVQSVAVRLIVEREREIDAFTTSSQYRVTAVFISEEKGSKKQPIKAELTKRFDTQEEAYQFLSLCTDASFEIKDLNKRLVKRSPAAPFTTSTLQQEAARKLRFSVSRTMLIAQRLYESGKITYMRTDSVNLSEEALSGAKQQISSVFGKEYHERRTYKTKSANAQEAHEAIRPTYYDVTSIDGDRDERVLYDLIYKRFIASQMADAELEKTTVEIEVQPTSDKVSIVSNLNQNKPFLFKAEGEIIKFEGFLKVYLESSDDDEGTEDEKNSTILPPLKVGEMLGYKEIVATQRYTRPPARFTEAALVKKLEELGIGRPSTYAPTISTIQKRGYVHKDEKQGLERQYGQLVLTENKKITTEVKTEITGADKGKLFPTDIAMVVNDFLIKNFPNIVDLQFTAEIEKELDDIATGELDWQKMLTDFYEPFKQIVNDTIETSERATGERILGNDSLGREVSVRIARFGPVAQIRVVDNPEIKPIFAGLRKDQKLESITLEEALELFRLPRTAGIYEEKDIVIAVGRFGPYVRHDGKFVSIPKAFDPYTISLDECITLIEEKRKKDSEKLIQSWDSHPDLQILNGRWGPYISFGDNNYKIPKGTDPKTISLEEVISIVGDVTVVPKSPAKGKSRKKGSSK